MKYKNKRNKNKKFKKNKYLIINLMIFKLFQVID